MLVLPSWASIEAPRALCGGQRLRPKERTRVVSARSRPLPIAGRNGTGGGALQDITNAAPVMPTRDSIVTSVGYLVCVPLSPQPVCVVVKGTPLTHLHAAAFGWWRQL